MAGQSNAAPVIIKRKKVIAGGGHHGGAWKVAYADFVTAMMAFFMLMWLLNATTEKQRKGIADYFNPTIPINRISGGGDGAFGGDSIFSEEEIARNGTGATSRHVSESQQARGDTGHDASADPAQIALQESRLIEVEKALAARGGESMTMEQALRHVTTKVTDEGLVIEIFDLPDAPLFEGDTNTPMPILKDVSALLAEVLALATNPVSVSGHVRAYPITLIDNPVWALSAQRATGVRLLLESGGLDPGRIMRVTGYADRKPVTTNAMAARNNRIEVVLLRRDR
jgi:chemotaxis protein MotB